MASEEQLMQVVQGHVKESLERYEEDLDRKLQELDEMSDDEVERIREMRVEQMKKNAQLRQEWLNNGHGRYRQVGDQKEFFRECKQSKRVVCHFFRSSTWRCQIMDRHLEKLSKMHLETKFIKVDAEKSPFLVEKLNVWMLPTLVLVKNTKTEHSVVGFDEFGGHDDFETAEIELVLAGHGIINEPTE